MTNINCSVHDCINNCPNNKCSLKSIKISKQNSSNSKDNTICDSYLQKQKI